MTIASRFSMWTSFSSKFPEVGYAFYKNNYASANVGSPNGKSALSFGGWFKLIAPSNEGPYLVCGWSQSGSWGSTHILKNSFRFGTGSSSTMFIIQGGELPINEWVHCIASYDGQKCCFFRNGILDSEYDSGPINMQNNDSQFRIASYDEGSLKYSSIAACQVFVLNKGISSIEEAQQLMSIKGFNKISSDSQLVDAWTMNNVVDNTFVGLKNSYVMNIQSSAIQIDGPERESNWVFKLDS